MNLIKMKNSIRKKQEEYFRGLYKKYEGTPMAVSSESIAHKKLRFSKISNIFENENNIQVHDIGVGVGDFYGFLKKNYPKKKIDFSGSEILIEYIKKCKEKFPNCKFYHRDISEKKGNDKYDYVVMSGVFHQKRETTVSQWERFSQQLIKNSFSMCRKGVAFNFVSPFVDFHQAEIYYCNLVKLLNFINNELSRFFTIHHDYALFEFTVFVYKEKYIKNKFPEKEFSKYFKL